MNVWLNWFLFTMLRVGLLVGWLILAGGYSGREIIRALYAKLPTGHLV